MKCIKKSAIIRASKGDASVIAFAAFSFLNSDLNFHCLGGERALVETHTFLVPDYYPAFSCKMGACREACCVGWPISISMKNYFHLVGLECRADLRRRLDCGMRVIDHPTEDRYAVFEPRYDGNCPLRQADGLCALQAELGEGILPDVCRLYPRGVRLEEGLYECSCSNSCEAVLELLMAHKGSLSFVLRRMTVNMPQLPERREHFVTLGMGREIRLYLISVIQERTMPLSARLACLGDAMAAVEHAAASNDTAALCRILSQMPIPIVGEGENVRAEHLRRGMSVAAEMTAVFDDRSQSIREMGERALSYFGSDDDSFDRYLAAREHFEAVFPNWESFFENILVNHMFFSVFPFQDRPEDMRSEYTALCAVYALMRFLSLGVMATSCDPTQLIDVMAAAFRLIDHTEFDRTASAVLRRLGEDGRGELYDLISL